MVRSPGQGHESGKSAAGPRFIGVHSPAMARLSFSRFAVLPLVTLVACGQPRTTSAQPTVPAQSTESAESSTTSQSAPQRPTLVVMITIDQMRPDYLTLWEKQFNGGLARLLRRVREWA